MQETPETLVEAQVTLSAKGKLTRILRSKTISEPTVVVDDSMEVLIKQGEEKLGNWTSSRLVFDLDPSTGISTVPGTGGHKLKVAVEDIRPALPEDFIANMVRDASAVVPPGLTISARVSSTLSTSVVETTYMSPTKTQRMTLATMVMTLLFSHQLWTV